MESISQLAVGDGGFGGGGGSIEIFSPVFLFVGLDLHSYVAGNIFFAIFATERVLKN